MEDLSNHLDSDFVVFTQQCISAIKNRYGISPRNMDVKRLTEFENTQSKTPQDYATWWIENEYEADDYFEPPTVDGRVV